MRVPDELQHLQNDELVAKLTRLTNNQVRGIAAIVAAGYTTEAIICPRHLLFGDDKICSSDMMYRAGRYNEELQRWTLSPGWARQPAFMDALNLAKRLALRYDVDDEYVAIRQTNHTARMASSDIMREMIRIARNLPPAAASTESTESMPSTPTDLAPRDQIAAATLVLKHAGLDTIPDDEGDNPESDWWRAAEEEA